MSRITRIISLLTLALCGALNGPAQAGTDNLDAGLADIQQHWAVIKYQTPDDQQEAAYAALAETAAGLRAAFPDRAEPRIWEAIVLSTYAGAKGGLGALGLVKQARELLVEAERIDAKALHGSVYTTLGSLYYQVPGWPLAFGDNDKARDYLVKAVDANPDGLDANYFYGDFLMQRGEYARAMQVLEHAMQAPPRPGREVADAGRRDEIAALMQRIRPFL